MNDYMVAAISGGKDSTAMLLLMLERDMPIDAVYADTGMEFPEMAAHMQKLDELLYRERSIHITTLRHPKGFAWWGGDAMNIRMNAGYIITDSIHVGETEFVLGVHSIAANQFVTWACGNGNDYNWGHYYSALLSATKDLLERATQELEFCMSDRAEANAHAPKKEPEEPCL